MVHTTVYYSHKTRKSQVQISEKAGFFRKNQKKCRLSFTFRRKLGKVYVCVIRRERRYTMKTVKDYVTTIPDFPKPGIMFRDVTSVLQDGDGLCLAIDEMQKKLEGVDFDILAGSESRGFIFGMPLAYNLHKPFALIRKAGKLPREVIRHECELEYGTTVLEMHKDDIKPGQKVVLVDDLIATGGTMKACAEMVEELGGEVVKMLFLLELAGLEGRKLLKGYDVDSVVVYEGK